MVSRTRSEPSWRIRTLLSYAVICSMPSDCGRPPACAPDAATSRTTAPTASTTAARAGTLRGIRRRSTRAGYKPLAQSRSRRARHIGCTTDAPGDDDRRVQRMTDEWRVLPPSPFATLTAAVEAGGERGLLEAARIGPAAVVDLVAASGLRGRGGAGFPTGRKWRT